MNLNWPILARIATALAIAFAFVSLFLWSAPDWIKKIILVAWTVFPPVWFLIEWQCQLKSAKGEDASWFNRFKYSQDLASKVWLAVAAVLSAVYFADKFIK